MTDPWRILCDEAELAVECARRSETIGLSIDPGIEKDPIATAISSIDAGPVAIAMARPPASALLVELAAAARAKEVPLPIAVVAAGEDRRRALELAGDLGLVAVDEVAPLLAAMTLISAGAQQPWTASTRALSALERIRLGPLVSARGGGRFDRADAGLIGWSSRRAIDARPIGEPVAVGIALRALEIRTLAAPPALAHVDGVDRRAVHDVIFGPPRALSDPASKSALAPYGLPLPVEELCSSPSRAAAEAARIGFPVRISLASPDLRTWDHPDLCVDGVDNAARVRDVYRQCMTIASERSEDARLLGVHVTATTTARAILRVVVEPLPHGSVFCEIGFADPHGRASSDRTVTALPAGPEAIERVLGRLDGASLVLEGSPAHRKAAVAAISDVLLRLTAFVNDHREEVERVDLHPMALLLGGAIEIREACVTVGDAFLRTLDSPRASGSR